MAHQSDWAGAAGEIPISILELARNDLTGAIPPCLLRLGRASTIDLSSNRFHGTMPSISSEVLWNLVRHASHARTTH